MRSPQFNALALCTAVLASISSPLVAADSPQMQELKEEVTLLKKQVALQSAQIAALQKAQKPQGSPASAPAGKGKTTGPGGATASTTSADGKSLVSASGSSASTSGKTANNFFEVPDSPAAAILGVSPQHVTSPSTPQQIIPALLNGVDDHGNFKSGVAIDIAPAQFFGVANKKPEDYLAADAYWNRLLSRTQISLATAKGTSATDKSMNLAVGLQVTLMNENDPVLKKFGSLNIPDKEIPGDLTNQLGLSGNQREPLSKALGETENLLQQWTHNSSWDVGAAQVWTSPDGASSNFNDAGYALYSTYAYGLELLDPAAKGPSESSITQAARTLQQNTQWLFQISYRNGEMVPNPKDSKVFLLENTTEGSLRLKFGTVRLNGSLIETVGSQHLSEHAKTLSHSTQFALEYKLGSNLWLTATMGKEFDDADGKNPVFAIGGLKFGADSTPPSTSSSN